MLRRKGESILVNNPGTLLVDSDTDYLEFKGYGKILLTDIVSFDLCCGQDCTAQEDVVTIVIPESCECPFEPIVTIQGKQGDMQSIYGGPFQKYEQYSGLNADGSTPTAAQAVANIVAAINANPYSLVEATDNGSGVMTLFEKDCSKSKGFTTFVIGGSVVTNTGHINATLQKDDMAKLFPINWGMQGSTPDLPIRDGAYCKWYFHLRSATPDEQDIDMDRDYGHSDREVTFYVLDNGSDYDTLYATVANIIINFTTCGQDYYVND
mgnify:CR=1 FL=1